MRDFFKLGTQLCVFMFFDKLKSSSSSQTLSKTKLKREAGWVMGEGGSEGDGGMGRSFVT